MIPASLRPRMWAYNRGNCRAPSGPLSSKMVAALYPECRWTIAELRSKSLAVLDAKGRVLKTIMWRLVRRGLVVRDKDGRYRLTDMGRWSVISNILGVSFVELCILACACCVQTRYAREGKTGFYMRSSFERVFGEYYSKKHMQQVFWLLHRKGFAVRHAKKTLLVYPVTRKDLMARYGTYLRRLESWVWEMKRREAEILSEVLEGFAPQSGPGQVRKGTRRSSMHARGPLGP